ncbi:hypothetical protein R1sor_008657 [Riccia sorocarpa]|uniref:Ion transport domain-containing protein n=1 Tax=Riccia sorocarpa TaxID=122646 RepID=A0ABD3HY63_9MARC
MSSSERKKGRRLSVPDHVADPSRDSGSHSPTREKYEIMLPSNEAPEPELLPASRDTSELPNASGYPESSTPLRGTLEVEPQVGSVIQMDASSASENPPAASLWHSGVEVSVSRSGPTSSWELASTDPVEQVEFLASSSTQSLERQTEPHPRNTGGELWNFHPSLVPPSSLDDAGPYKAADRVVTPVSHSMSELEITTEPILRMGNGMRSRNPSKIDNAGRSPLGRGEISESFLQGSVGNAGEDGGRNTVGESSSSSKGYKQFVDLSESVPLVPRTMPLSPPRCVVSRENQRFFQHYAEFPLNVLSWDGMKKLVSKRWRSFNNWNNRRTLKRIKASLPILRTYHDAILYGEVPVNLKARTRIRAGWIGFLWHIVEFSLGVISAGLYVYSTYHKEERDSVFIQVQNIISVAFLADYLIRLYTEKSRFYYVFSFWGAMDFVSAVPVILIFREKIAGQDFIKLLHFVRLVRIFALINKSHVGRSVNQQVVLLSVGTLVVILLFAGIVQWIEYYTAPVAVRNSCPESGCLSFWAAFYFLIVTVGTVGFGDITPKTILGQFVICVAIVAALTVIPIRVKHITSLASLSPYGGSVSSRKLLGSRFVILGGGISFLAVQNFLAEFFKRTSQQEFDAFPVRVVIMGSNRPSFELKQVLIRYQGRAEFIEGSPLRVEDLERVSAHKALAVLLMAYQETQVIKFIQVLSLKFGLRRSNHVYFGSIVSA